MAQPAGRTPERFAHAAMACTFELVLTGKPAAYCAQAAHAAWEEIDRLENLLSRFIAHSDIARLSAARPGEFMSVSPEASECLQLAAMLYAVTGGAFDVAYRSRGKWRTAAAGAPGGRGGAAGRRGSGGDARDAPPAPLVLDPVHQRIRVEATGLDLDLGALGKGYAVDRAVAVLQEWRIPAGLVSSGQSSVRAFGRPGVDDPALPLPDRTGRRDAPVRTWRVQLRDPRDQVGVLGVVELGEAALSGSGQKLHGAHIVDPRSGQPAPEGHATWAVAPTAAVSDALSTAFMVLTAGEIEAVCAALPGAGAILLDATRPGLVTYGAARAVLDAATDGSE